MDIKINYEEALENHMRADAERALQCFIQGSVGYSMTLFPQTLNPFMKALESIGTWRQALVLPYSDSKNKPLYIIVKIPFSEVTDLSVNEIREI